MVISHRLDLYSIDGWYTHPKYDNKVLQNGAFLFDVHRESIEQGYIYDNGWGFADIAGIFIPLTHRPFSAKLQFKKHYSDFSSDVEYIMKPTWRGWKGTWKDDHQTGEGRLWVHRMDTNVNPDEISFVKVKIEYMRPRRTDLDHHYKS